MTRPTGRPVGRPPKPVEKKIAEGNLGKRKLPPKTLRDSNISVDIPEAPETFSEAETEIWMQIWKAGGSWLKIERDFLIIKMLCEEIKEYNYLKTMLSLGSAAGGEDRIIKTKNGYPIINPMVSLKNDSQKKIMTYISSIGFSPADFARLQFNDVSSSEDAILQKILTNSTSRRRQPATSGEEKE